MGKLRPGVFEANESDETKEEKQVGSKRLCPQNGVFTCRRSGLGRLKVSSTKRRKKRFVAHKEKNR